MIVSHSEARRLERRELSARARHAARILKRITRDRTRAAVNWSFVAGAAALFCLTIIGLGL